VTLQTAAGSGRGPAATFFAGRYPFTNTAVRCSGWHNGSFDAREKPMDSGSLASIDWGVVTLVALIAAGLVWSFVFFLRQNSKDLESLEETIESERRDDER
jgi:hypothetical protein